MSWIEAIEAADIRLARTRLSISRPIDHMGECRENTIGKLNVRFLRVGTMVSSHEGTIGKADCAVAVRAIQIGVEGYRVSKKVWKDIS